MAEILEIIEITAGDEIIEVGDIILTAGYDVTDAVLVNVTNYVPLGAGEYYTLTTAIAAVPNDMRKTGLKITFATASGVWVSYQFKGASIVDWATESNWEMQGVSKKYVDDGLLLKENTANKKTSINDSDTEFPTSKAVKTALDAKVEISNVANNLTTTDAGKVLDARQGPVITAALETKAAHGYTGTAKTLKEVDDAKVSKTGDETVAGVKTFSSSPVIPTPTTDMQSSTKKYVDDADLLKTDKTATENVEEVTANSLVILKNRIDALEAVLRNGVFSGLRIDTLDVIGLLNAYGGTNLVITGSGAPTIVPDFIGQLYLDYTTPKLYAAKGITTTGDWFLT